MACMWTPAPLRDNADYTLDLSSKHRLTTHFGQVSRRLGQLGLADSKRRHNICRIGQPTKTSRRSPPQRHLQHIQEDKASDSLLAYTYGNCLWCDAMGDGEVRTQHPRMEDGDGWSANGFLQE